MGTVNSAMDSDFLIALTLEDIRRHFDLHHEDLLPLALYIKEDVFEIGTQLLARGYRTPGEFVADNVSPDPKQSSGDRGVAHMVGALVENFPLTFRDEYIVNNQTVCFYKKAQLVVSEIYMRFPHMFYSSDTDNLTAFVDNVVVAMMRMNGVVKCCPELEHSLSTGHLVVLKGSEEEVALRSAALHAVEVIVARCKLRNRDTERGSDRSTYLNSQILCNYLWGCLGKDGANRQYPRHLAPGTSFY